MISGAKQFVYIFLCLKLYVFSCIHLNMVCFLEHLLFYFCVIVIRIQWHVRPSYVLLN